MRTLGVISLRSYLELLKLLRAQWHGIRILAYASTKSATLIGCVSAGCVLGCRYGALVADPLQRVRDRLLERRCTATEAFHALDTDRDGFVSRTEFTNGTQLCIRNCVYRLRSSMSGHHA